MAGSGSERESWMDLLRGCAIVLVILLHAALIVERFGIEPWNPLLRLNQAFAPFRMPMLVFLSGLLLQKSLDKGWFRYLDGKARNIAYPYLLWSLVYFVTIYDGPDDHTLWIGASYLWYLLFLLVYYGIALVTGRIPPILLALLALGISFLTPDGTKYYERFFYLMGIFFLGHAIGRFPALLNLATSRIWALALLPVAVFLSWTAIHATEIRYKAELIGPTLAGLIVVIHLARTFAGRRFTRPLEYIGRYSLIFYVVHYPLIYMIMGLSLAMKMDGAPALSLLSFWIALPLCFLAARAAQRSSVVRLFFSYPPLIVRRAGQRPFTKISRASI